MVYKLEFDDLAKRRVLVRPTSINSIAAAANGDRWRFISMAGQMLAWCEENVPGYELHSLSWHDGEPTSWSPFVLHFPHERDVIHFKLRWFE